MAQIIPAILPKSYEELEEKIDLAGAHAPVIQIDICDGSYTSSRTWPYLKGPQVEDTIFADLVSQEKAFPHWEEVDFEFDLMVRNAYEKIPDFISAGASRIVVHKLSVKDEELENIINDFGMHSNELGIFDVELGIALMPGGATGSDTLEQIVESIADIADRIHFVQVMGISHVGFQGQAADPRAVGLVKALKTAYPELPVSVDGAVTGETAPALLMAGADRLVIGSALFGSDDFLGTLKEFEAM